MTLRSPPLAGSGQRDDPSARTARRKGVLFCPDCGHASHVDGDWRRSESAERTRVECPVCGAVVVTQPGYAGAAAD